MSPQTEPKEHSPIDDLRTLLGADAVLLPIPPGTKAPVFLGWDRVTLEQSSDPNFEVQFPARVGDKKPRRARYLWLLSRGNIGVLQGSPSKGLCSIDVDDDTQIEELLRLNPVLKGTLQTRGSRGRNFWIRVTDVEGPIESFDLYGATGTKAIEFRADGRQTVVFGKHPSGSDYVIVNAARPVEVKLSDLKFPAGLSRKVARTKEEYRSTASVDSTKLRRRREIIEKFLPDVEWIDNTRGFCTCPFEAMHSKTGDKTMVFAGGKPHIHCFHTSCQHDLTELLTIKILPAIYEGERIQLPNAIYSRTDCAQRVAELLLADMDSGIFIRGGQPVTVIDNGGDEVRFEPLDKYSAASRFELAGQFGVWNQKTIKEKDEEGNKTERTVTVWEPKQLSVGVAAELLKTGVFERNLPVVSTVHRCPIMFEDAKTKRLEVAKHGYNGPLGAFIAGGGSPVEPPVSEAVEAILGLLSDYTFATPGDKSRAVAGLLSPMMRWGGLIPGRFPIDIVEADHSQSGKTLLKKVTAAIYRQHANIVTVREGGVGSLDESVGSALASGKPLLVIDNVRETLKSAFLEALTTAHGEVQIRLPGGATPMVDPEKFIIAITANNASLSEDLANRGVITRIKKRPGYSFPLRDGLGLDEYVASQQPYFLGCVFAIIRAWHAAGKPGAPVLAHPCGRWVGVMDWIVREIFKLTPLMDGHDAAAVRAVNPSLNWVHRVAAMLKRRGDWNRWVRAGEIMEAIAEEGGDVLPPGYTVADLSRDDGYSRGRTAVGRCLGRAFPAIKTPFPATEGCHYAHDYQLADGEWVHRVVRPWSSDRSKHDKVYWFGDTPTPDMSTLPKVADGGAGGSRIVL